MRNRYQCPYCGANLDPGEKCDCQEPEEDTDPENKKSGDARQHRRRSPRRWR